MATPDSVRFNRYHVSCPACKIVTEGLDVLPVRAPRVTKPLADLVYELCKMATHKAVGLLSGLHRETLKNIDRAMMEMQRIHRIFREDCDTFGMKMGLAIVVKPYIVALE